MTQPSLFDQATLARCAEFDGATYDGKRDHSRLAGQILAVYELMRDGEWRTVQEIADAIDAPGTSVSAQLRNLRKPKLGGHKVERRWRDRAERLSEYRVVR